MRLVDASKLIDSQRVLLEMNGPDQRIVRLEAQHMARSVQSWQHS